jgi:hypothetical protein
MDERVFHEPLTFDHPEKLLQGITVDEGDVSVKSYLDENEGCIRFNTVITNKATGKETRRDVVVGELAEEDVEEE